MSNGNTTVSLTLKLRGQQAQQVLEQLNKSQERSATELLKTNRYLGGVLRQQAQQTGIQARQYQQMNTLVQQQRSVLTQTTTQTQASLRTNQLLERVLQQQVRQSTQLTRQTRNQNRDYQLQVNMLRQQAAAAERLRQQLEAASRAQRDATGSGGRFGTLGAVGGGIATGAAAAYAITRNPLEKARSFETKIFDANTSINGGYSNMTHQQVVASNLQLSGYARDAVRQGHGTVEGIGDAAGILAASGLYKKVDELKVPLLAIAKTAFANGAAEQDVAMLTQQIRQFGVVPDRTQVALDRATQSGFAGGFEIKDMARLLPEVLPFAKTAGYSGEEGLNQVTTHMQLARKYTGLPSQAADNMRDLYSLFSQNHFALSIGKYIKLQDGDPIKKIGLKGNRTGFDITTYLANQKLKGVDTVTATVMLMNRQLSKNKRFVELQNQIATAEKSGDQSKAIGLKTEAMNIVAAGEFGKIFHNQQSLSGLMSIIAGLNNGDFDRISQQSWNGEGSNERVAKEKSVIEPAQAHALEQETILATIKVYDQVKGTLGEFESGLKDTMVANQALAASALAAAGVLSVLAAAGVGARMGGGLGGAGAAGAKKWLVRGAIPLTVGAGAYNFYQTANDKSLSQYQKNVKESGIVGGTGGAIVGAMAGAAAGSVIPVVGTAIGGLVGGALGYWGGSEAGEALGEYFSEQSGILENQNKLLEEQNKQTAQVVKELQKLPSALSGVINVDFSGLGLNNTGNREGATPTKPLVFKNPY